MKTRISLIFITVVLVGVGCSTQGDNRPLLPLAAPSPASLLDVAPSPYSSEQIDTSAPNGKTAPAVTPAQAVNGPRIAFNSDNSDWGRVPYNTQIEQVYEFTNVGNEVLKVLDVPTISVLEGC